MQMLRTISGRFSILGYAIRSVYVDLKNHIWNDEYRMDFIKIRDSCKLDSISFGVFFFQLPLTQLAKRKPQMSLHLCFKE